MHQWEYYSLILVLNNGGIYGYQHSIDSNIIFFIPADVFIDISYANILRYWNAALGANDQMKDFSQLPSNTTIYAIGYVRVSDRKQEEEGDSLTTQEKAIRRYAEKQGWILLDVVKEVFSGFYLHERTKLTKEIREPVRNHIVNVIIVNSLDRLSREPIHQAVLLNEMIENKVRLESITEPLDNSPLGNFLRQALAFAAAIEREKIIERNIRGVQNKVEDGKMIGTGKAKYGYCWGDEKHTFYTVNPITGTIVHRIFNLYISDHMSVRGIAGKLHTEGIPTPSGKGNWGTTTVRRILIDKFYIGEGTNRRIKWEWVDGKKRSQPHPNPTPLPEGIVPPIVTKDIWYATQEKLGIAKQEAARNNKEPEQTLLRSGYIYCGYCGRAMTVVRYLKQVKGKKYPTNHYRCGAANTPAFNGCNKKTIIVIGKIDTAAWNFARNILNEISTLQDILQNNSLPVIADLASIDKLIINTEAEQERIIKDLHGLSGRARELMLTELKHLEDNLQKLHAERNQTRPHADRAERLQTEVNEFFRWCNQFKGQYNEATYEEKRRALRMLGIRVTIYRPSDPDHEQYTITARPEIIDRLAITTTIEK